jgi:hypothetical protein
MRRSRVDTARTSLSNGRMRCRIAMGLLLLAEPSACTRDSTVEAGPLPPDGTAAVDLHTDKSQYRIGDSAKSTMVNHTPDVITMGVCSDVLERDSGAQWVEVPQPLIACPAIALIVNPGDSVTLSLNLGPASTPATYRVRRQFSVSHGSSSESTYRRSNTFTMSR